MRKEGASVSLPTFHISTPCPLWAHPELVSMCAHMLHVGVQALPCSQHRHTLVLDPLLLSLPTTLVRASGSTQGHILPIICPCVCPPHPSLTPKPSVASNTLNRQIFHGLHHPGSQRGGHRQIARLLRNKLLSQTLNTFWPELETLEGTVFFCWVFLQREKLVWCFKEKSHFPKAKDVTFTEVN